MSCQCVFLGTWNFIVTCAVNVKVRLNLDAVGTGFINMMLSFRGGERQPPNMLQMALRFSSAMDARSVHGVHGSLLQLQEAWISPRVTCAEKLGADLQMLQAKGYLLGHASECAN